MQTFKVLGKAHKLSLRRKTWYKTQFKQRIEKTRCFNALNKTIMILMNLKDMKNNYFLLIIQALYAKFINNKCIYVI